METIIVEIFVPAISESFDFQLPAAGRVYDVIREIAYVLTATQQNITFDEQHPMLCDLDRGLILKNDAFIAETQIHDGTRLMLV